MSIKIVIKKVNRMIFIIMEIKNIKDINLLKKLIMIDFKIFL